MEKEKGEEKGRERARKWKEGRKEKLLKRITGKGRINRIRTKNTEEKKRKIKKGGRKMRI